MISTKRLTINHWTPADAGAFFELSQDEGFNLFPINVYCQSSLEGAQEWVQKASLMNQQTGLGKFSVWDKSHSLLGMGGLTPWTWEGEELIDITYRLRQSAWGKGYGMELAESLVEYGFGEAGLTQITATITPDNHASKKIAERLGLKYDRRIQLQGVPTDLYRLYRD